MGKDFLYLINKTERSKTLKSVQRRIYRLDTGVGHVKCDTGSSPQGSPTS